MLCQQEESSEGRKTQFGLHELEEVAAAFDDFYDAAAARLNAIRMIHFGTLPHVKKNAEGRAKRSPQQRV